MSQQEVLVSEIAVGNRRRPIDVSIIKDLKQSISQQGLLQNIGVKKLPDGYHLVFGLHRLEAVKALKLEKISARVFPAETPEDECLLAEIQENLARKDLSKAERKAFTAEVGRIIAKIGKNCDDGIKCDSQFANSSQWLEEIAKRSNTPTRTIRDWWAAFCKETNRSITPKQANDDDRNAFFSWLDEQKRKVAEAEAEKEKKIADAKKKARDKFKADLFDALDQTIKEYGEETAFEWVHEWMNEHTTDGKANCQHDLER